MNNIIGIDTGGTFTDVIVLGSDGTSTSAKAVTTPEDLTVGVFAALDVAAAELDCSVEELLAETGIFRLSGTTVTNVLLTRQGAAPAMITTGGFEDTLKIGRATSTWAGLTEQETRHLYRRTKPTQLIDRRFIRGVAERTDHAGTVVVAVDEAHVERAANELVEQGAKSIAICFLWSIRNPENEARAAEVVRAAHPDLSLHVSHEIAPAVGEYERFTTTAVDALVGPVMKRILRGLMDALRERGFAGEVIVAQADGGSVYAEEASAVSTLQSGPAAGVIAARNEGARLGLPNIVTADVGGTSFDVAVISNGSWLYAREPVVEKFRLSLPMIEVESVGAGGGSIAWIDEVGVLHVGPQSAGAQPGPVCYGRGGMQPTVTDAALVLGYVNPDFFLGGRVALATDSATRAIARLGEPLALSAVETAAGIHEIANSHMAGLVTRRVVSRGFDPRDFTIFAYGGAGGMHAAFYAAEAGIAQVVVPSVAGTFSALGVATAPLLHSKSFNDFAPLPMEPERFIENFRRLEDEVVDRLARDGVADADRRLVFALEMRYGVQVHTVRLVIDRALYETADFDVISSQFDAEYERLYGKGSGYGDAGRFVDNFIVEGYGTLPIPERRAAERGGADASHAVAGTRRVYFSGGFVDTSIFRLPDLRAGNRIEGPAVIEAAETTIVIPPEQHAHLDEDGNVRIQVHLTEELA